MKRPTNIQIIEQGGIPAFAVIPYADFLEMFPEKDDVTIPHDVVGIIAKEGCNLLRAWRKYLTLTQREVAQKAGITQSALSQMELSDSVKRTGTLEKLAIAMNLNVEQLTD
jgi:DNA-binding XRE family transcriptional regulator